MKRRAFLKGAAGLFVPVMPALILPKEARAQLNGGMMFPGPGTPASTSAFTPASLSGLIVWLKADAGVSLSGSSVTQWTDQKSSIPFTTTYSGGSGSSPTFSSTGFNTSFPGISWINPPPNTGLYSGASAVSFGATNNTATFSCVVNINSSAGNAAPLLAFLATGDSNENSGANSVDIRYITSPDIQVVQNSSGFTTDTVATNTNYRMLWEFDGTNQKSYFNNVLQSSAALNFNFGASGSGNGALGLGNFYTSAGGANYLTFAEIVITKNAISSTDRTNLDNYFKAKWGL